MQYKLNLSLDEKDDSACQEFFTFHNPESKQRIRSNRLSLLIIGAILLPLSFLLHGDLRGNFNPMFAVMGIYLFFYGLFYNKIITANIRKQAAAAKASGKLAYDPLVKLEFYEDRLVEIVPNGRYEEKYVRIAHIYVLKNRYIFCRTVKSSVHILPIAQLQEQLDVEEFLDFLSTKCQNITYC